MFKRFIDNSKMGTQILIIMSTSLLALTFFGGIGALQIYHSETLSEAEVLSERLGRDFKTQVQEWKNILIRGGNPEDYKKYTEAFYRKTNLVRDQATQLNILLSQNNISTANIEKFLEAHRQTETLYLSGLDQLQGNDWQSIRNVDALVRGIDREPAQILEDIIQDLDMASQSESVRLFALAVIAAFIIGLILVLLYTRAISARLGAMVKMAAALSRGELDTRIPLTGRNELGELAAAFNSMADRLGEIVGNVQQSGVRLSGAALDVSATARQQAASAKEQEATTHEIMATSQQIAQTSQDLVNNMDEVAQAMDAAATLADQGRGGLTRMGTAVGQMVEASSSISDKLAVLNDKAGNISSVVTTINKIADQTNLLSVNAAIEADKAGEYGIGFGTVATEIRRLADQTAVATWDIEEMVKEMQSAVSAGVMGMEKFSDQVHQGVDDTRQISEQLTQIVEQVQALAPHFESVHTGMRSQSRGAEQIQGALTQLSETIRNLNESMNQSNSVVNNLNQESDRLQESVQVFKFSHQTQAR